MSLGAKDLITPDNVVKTYSEGKYICFQLKNGFTVKLNPNQVSVKGSGADKQGGK
jgi:hypothetical protein